MHHSLSVIRFQSLRQGQKTLPSSELTGQTANYAEQFICAFDVRACLIFPNASPILEAVQVKLTFQALYSVRR